jgi:magnesium-transporting ATPase (P-type)
MTQPGPPSDPGGDRDPEPAIVAARAWHALTASEVLAHLAAGEGGLSEDEAAARRRRVGPNELPRAARDGLIRIYLRQFKNPLVYLLLGATAVSLGVGEFTDAAFIFVVLQSNAAIGTYQEWTAAASAAELDALIRNVVVALRDGTPRQVDAAELVPGDVVKLESGTLVPADLRLLAGWEVTVDESLLTGESTPVTKDAESVLTPAAPLVERRNMLFAGTTVLLGRVTGVVAATGAATQVGRIAAALVSEGAAPPPLVARLEQFSRVIGFVTLGLIALLAGAQLVQGLPLVTVFLFAVALAVAAIPEGMPVAITVALSIASTRMAGRNVIVRALPAVEGLGACTLIASDKTGTLTCNELTVKRVVLFGAGRRRAGPAPLVAEVGGEGYRPQGAILVAGQEAAAEERAALLRLAESGALCNEASFHVAGDAVEHLGDTVDVAFLVLGAKLGLDTRSMRSAAPQLGLIPYEPHRRFGASFIREDHGGAARAVAHVKGAAEVLLPMCAGLDRPAALAEADRLAAAGYRVIAVARGPVAMDDALAAAPEALRGLELLGLVGLIDPVRPEVPDAVARCRAAGITVVMITGDHPDTALAIARQLDIARDASEVATGAELAEARDEPGAFDRRVTGARVFARVEPVQKLAIVQALQGAGEVVAVSGDGVNDAPALSAGDIGVAMGRGGTDVARGAADLLLADDNFASIVGGVEEGRIAYDNVRKLIFLLIAMGLAEIALFLLAVFAGLPIPLFAVQLLWLNLVTEGVQTVALAFERGEPGVLQRRPRPPGQPLFDRPMIVQVLVSGVYVGVVAFVFYRWCLAQGMDTAAARNLLLLLLVLFENVHVFNARSETRSVFKVSFAANPFVVLAALGAQLLHIAAMYLPGLRDVLDLQPIGWADWFLVAPVALSLLLVVELYKWLLAPRLRRPGGGASIPASP